MVSIDRGTPSGFPGPLRPDPPEFASVGLSTTWPSSTSTTTRAPGGSTSRAWAGRWREPVGPTTAYSAPPRPSALTRPSRMVTVRSMAAATSASWVTTTTVVPRSSRASLSSSTTRRTLARSSWLVGSSASSRGGLLARATATARRCCSPPDRARIGLPRCAPRSTASSSTSARRLRRPAGSPASTIGRSRFSQAEACGSRLRAVPCQTNPSRRRRSMVSWASDRRVTSMPSSTTRPAEGRSRPPRMASMVDLPDPDGPSRATISPQSTPKSTPWRATTSRPSSRYRWNSPSPASSRAPARARRCSASPWTRSTTVLTGAPLRGSPDPSGSQLLLAQEGRAGLVDEGGDHGGQAQADQQHGQAEGEAQDGPVGGVDRRGQGRPVGELGDGREGDQGHHQADQAAAEHPVADQRPLLDRDRAPQVAPPGPEHLEHGQLEGAPPAGQVQVEHDPAGGQGRPGGRPHEQEQQGQRGGLLGQGGLLVGGHGPALDPGPGGGQALGPGPAAGAAGGPDLAGLGLVDRVALGVDQQPVAVDEGGGAGPDGAREHAGNAGHPELQVAGNRGAHPHHPAHLGRHRPQEG